MKKIIKGKEPISLTHYRSSISSANMNKETIYEEYKENSILRKQLLEEQGYICCYCMNRIAERNSKIEHFKPQSKFRGFQISYSNLFISCKGGEGNSEKHCDTKKDNKELNEMDLVHNNDLKYCKNGRISSLISRDNKESKLTKELNEVLNLNAKILVKNRKQTYNDFKNNLKGKWNKSTLQKAIKHYQTKHNGKYEPYCEMMVYLLTNKIQGK